MAFNDPNIGLLGGLAEGLKAGVGAYQDQMERKRRIAQYEADQKMKKVMTDLSFAKEGYLPPGEDGGLIVDTNPESPFNREKELAEQKNQAFLQATMDKTAYQNYQNELARLKLEDQQKRTGLLEKKTDADIGLIKKKTNAVGVAKPEKITAEMSKVAGFTKRLEQSEKNFKDIEEKGYEAGNRLDKLRGFLPGEFRSENALLQEQAERNFINSVLRRESGAAISPTEFSSAEQQYFPRPGDTPSVKEQKKANRQQVYESFKAEASGAYDRIPTVKTGAVPKSKDISREEKLKRLQQLEGK